MKVKPDVPKINIPNYILKKHETYQTNHNSIHTFTFYHRYLRSLKKIKTTVHETEGKDFIHIDFFTYSFLFGKKTKEKQEKKYDHIQEQIKRDPLKRLSYVVGSRKIVFSDSADIEDWNDFLLSYLMVVCPLFIGTMGFLSSLILLFIENIGIGYVLFIGMFSAMFSGLVTSIICNFIITIAYRNFSKQEIFRSYKVTGVFALVFTILYIFY